MCPAPVGGSVYYVSFEDEHSKYATIYPVSRRIEVLSTYVLFLYGVYKHSGQRGECFASSYFLEE